MTEAERNELLIAIKEKLDNLIKAFDKVSNGTGFPRCVERAQRIMRLEQDVIALKAQAEKLKTKTDSLDVLQSKIDDLARLVEGEKNKKDRTDVWIQRTTWVVIIAGVIKFAFF